MAGAAAALHCAAAHPHRSAHPRIVALLGSLTCPPCTATAWQGLEDEVVPPNQAEVMFEAIKERGVPTALVMFEGEQHGFRQAPNIRCGVGAAVVHGRWLLSRCCRSMGGQEIWARPFEACWAICPCMAVPPARCPLLPALQLAAPACFCRCRRALDGELYFYGRVLGFQPKMPEDFQPIEIANI
jgi:hypothetical protein